MLSVEPLAHASVTFELRPARTSEIGPTMVYGEVLVNVTVWAWRFEIGSSKIGPRVTEGVFPVPKLPVDYFKLALHSEAMP